MVKIVYEQPPKNAAAASNPTASNSDWIGSADLTSQAKVDVAGMDSQPATPGSTPLATLGIDILATTPLLSTPIPTPFVTCTLFPTMKPSPNPSPTATPIPSAMPTFTPEPTENSKKIIEEENRRYEAEISKIQSDLALQLAGFADMIGALEKSQADFPEHAEEIQVEIDSIGASIAAWEADAAAQMAEARERHLLVISQCGGQ
ncbi:MAG: hypothetical protein VB049_08960 [Candidatus Pelethousia sp.]|nr:hypothetical protein [Candidatus Pelethousia sp.]